MNSQNFLLLALNVSGLLAFTGWNAPVLADQHDTPDGAYSVGEVFCQPAWAVKYGDEFWRSPEIRLVGARKTGLTSSRSAAMIDAGETVERVCHALSRDSDSGLPGLRAGSYVANFDGRGLRFSPVAGRKTGTGAELEARFRTRTIRRDGEKFYSATPQLEWSVIGNTAQALLNARYGIVEHCETRRDGVEVTWLIGRPLPGSGPLIIESEMGGVGYAEESPLGYRFTNGVETTAVQVGRVTVVDNAGRCWQIPAQVGPGARGMFQVEVPASILREARYPLAIDPLISAEFNLGIGCPPPGALTGNFVDPAVAFDGSVYLVVWQDSRNLATSGTDIYGARIDLNGSILDPCGFVICSAVRDQRSPAVAANGTGFLVVWEDDRNDAVSVGVAPDIFGAIVNGNGGVSANTDISRVRGLLGGLQSADGAQRKPAVAANATDFFVVWENSNSAPLIPSNGVDIYGAHVRAAQGSVGQLRLSSASGDEHAPAVAANSDGFLVVWEDNRDAAVSGTDIYGSFVSAATINYQATALGALSTEVIGLPNLLRPARENQLAPAVASDGSGFMVVWRDQRNSVNVGGLTLLLDSIYGARLDRAGGVLDPNGIRITSSDLANHPAIAANGCDYLVVWDEGQGNALNLRCTSLDLVGRPLTPSGEFIKFINNSATAPQHPTIAAGPSGQFLVISQTIGQGGFYTLGNWVITPGGCGLPIPGLFNTGVDNTGTILSGNDVDPHYQLVQSADPSFPGPLARVVNEDWPIAPAGPWLASGPRSMWIAPRTLQTNGNLPGMYFYQTSFDLSGLDPRTVKLIGQWSTDDTGVAVYLNGASQGLANQGGFGAWTPFQLSTGFINGVNSLVFQVSNDGTARNPTGLRVEFAGIALPLSTNYPACLVVTTDADSGPGSLRAAIDCANNHPGRDTITFAIPGVGLQTIRPLSALPAITDPVEIDGYSQPGAHPNTVAAGNDARLQISVNGIISTAGFGLRLETSNSLIRGLLMQNFHSATFNSGCAICVVGENNRIEGNFLGTDLTGMLALGNDLGVTIEGNSGNIVGGSAPAQRNLISGNGFAGILIKSGSLSNRIYGNYIGTDRDGASTLPHGMGAVVIDGLSSWNFVGGDAPGMGNLIAGSDYNVFVNGFSNVVQGNRIGCDRTGTRSLSPGSVGIFLQWENNLIGGSQPGAGNLISGNAWGVISHGAQNLIQGNWIGTDASGLRGLANSAGGILLQSAVNFDGRANIVGGLGNGEGNVIAFNGGPGVLVADRSSIENQISANSIFNNQGLGIDLTPTSSPANPTTGDGVTANDPGDTDSGPNLLQNFPILTSAGLASGSVLVEGTLNSKPVSSYRIELFANTVGDPSGYGEGELFLGFTNIITDATGTGRFLAMVPAVACKPFITATATDADGNTSEFSAAVGLASAASIPCLWNTGVDSSGTALFHNALDGHYVLLAGSPVQGTPFVVRESAGFPIPPWLVGSTTSAWIAPTTNTLATGAFNGSAVYRYETAFDLTGFDPSTVVISGRWATDNRGTNILINGISTGQANVAQFGAWTPFQITNGFVAGTNRLTFLVSNGEGELNPDGPTGLRVEMCGVGTLNIPLFIQRRGNQIVITWRGAGFMLQTANNVTGPWADFSAGTSANGIDYEVAVQPTAAVKFFRLRLNRPCPAP